MNNTPQNRRKPQKPQSARILDIQNRISDLYKAHVRVTGKESKGKIAFSYDSKEELDMLLERLSDSALANANRVAPDDENRLAQVGVKYKILDDGRTDK